MYTISASSAVRAKRQERPTMPTFFLPRKPTAGLYLRWNLRREGENVRTRDHEIHVLWTKEEMERLHQKMAEAGVQNRSAYVRKMTLDGYIVKLDLEDVREMIRLLRNATNNLNQLAKKTNAGGRVYGEDIADLQTKQNEIWETAKAILDRLAAIQ